MFMTDNHPVAFPPIALDTYSNNAVNRQHLRSVPTIVRRKMHRAEPIEMIKVLRWQWWTKPLIDGGQTLYRILTLPIGQSSNQRLRDR